MHLVLFLSRATPLCRWQAIGILDRETAVYQRLHQRVGKVSIISSGGKEELFYVDCLGDIPILYNRWRLPPNLYSLLAPVIHLPALQQATVYKTNQLDGAWTAVLAAKLYRKPVIVRAGYLWAQGFSRQQGEGVKARFIRRLEKYVYQNATHINLTTSAMKEYVVQTYGIPEKRITVVPNYVDTTIFRPLPDVTKVDGQVCYVGRLYFRKNLNLLVEALATIPQAHLVLVGQGEEQPPLELLAAQHGVTLTLPGLMPNQQLPLLLNQSAIFVLPSKFEGHPKALIEAMACGTAVIGTDVEGINNVIQHGETGWLCPPTVEGLRQAIIHLLANPAERDRLGRQARQYVQENFALEKIVEKELSVIQQVVAAHQGGR